MSVQNQPPVTPSEMQLFPMSNTAINESPTNKSTETLEMAGARWEGFIQFNNINEKEEKLLQAWLAGLRGAAGRFKMPHYKYLSPEGEISGAPVIGANNQHGGKLALSNVPVNKKIFVAGDFVTINNELKVVREDCHSNGLGKAELKVEPPMRQVVNQGEVVGYQNPFAIFRLKDDKQGKITLRKGKPGKLKIQIVEAF